LSRRRGSEAKKSSARILSSGGHFLDLEQWHPLKQHNGTPQTSKGMRKYNLSFWHLLEASSREQVPPLTSTSLQLWVTRLFYSKVVRELKLTGGANCGVWEASHPPIYSNLQESWSKGSRAARELATVFSVTFIFVTIVGQLVKHLPPPAFNRRCFDT